MKNIIIGLMSGTSLDGLDIVACTFTKNNSKISFNILEAETFEYNQNWIERLKNAPLLPAYDFMKLHSEYGLLLGNLSNQFLEKHSFKHSDIDFIASHGHTIFHKPNEGITTQIGDGTKIHAKTNIRVIYDFRQLDVALGGQGAPLVPIGDEALFSEYKFCLNLGGFANVSYNSENQRIAFDIVPVNFVLNYLANRLNLTHDPNGLNASKGKVNLQLLEKLNNLSYYTQPIPKSLGREWVETNILPFLSNNKLSVCNLLRTFVEHICIQISGVIKSVSHGEILITGGGAYNTFLINRLQELTEHKIIIPNDNIVNFKEALIFALLGWLKINNIANVLSSYTGACRNSISGIIING